MKIKSINISNFRSIKQLTMDFNQITVIVGPNNAGKSNILSALNLFFTSSTRGITDIDFHKRNVKEPIEISVKFCDLSQAEQATFKNYIVEHELNVRKTISMDESGTVTTKLQGLVNSPKDPILRSESFDSNKGEILSRIKDGGLPNCFLSEKGSLTKKSFQTGLETYISKNSDSIEFDRPQWSESFFGWKNVAQGKLVEIIYVPAIKEAADELKSSSAYMGILIERLFEGLNKDENYQKTKNSYEKISDGFSGNSTGLARFSEIVELEKKIGEKVSEHIPGIKAKLYVNFPDFLEIVSKSLNLTLDDGVETSVEFKGHGLQRAVIMAMLRLYAELLSEGTDQKMGKSGSMVLAIEEPELYLHPHHQRKLYDVLKRISEVNQVIFCTHSSYFVNLSDYESIRIVNKDSDSKSTFVRKSRGNIFQNQSDKTTFRTLSNFDPTKSELFFSKRVILVEGPSERVAIGQIAEKTNYSLDGNEVTIIECEGKTGIPIFMEVLNSFQIPYVVIHDTDLKNKMSKDQKSTEEVRNNRIKNLANGNKIITFSPDLECELGIHIKNEKPYNIYLRMSEKKIEDINKSFVNKIQCLLNAN